MTTVPGSTPVLNEVQARLLWCVAQHKYGWCYLNSVGQRSTGRALERRGLVTVEINHTGFSIEATDAGKAEIAERWPNSPLALGTYNTPARGWDKP